MSKSRFVRRNTALIAAAAASLAAAGSSWAATVTWTGGGVDGNWQNAANWSAATVAGDVLDFAGATNLTTNNDFAADTSFSRFNFVSGAGAFTLGGNSVVLGNGITQDSASNQTVSLPLVVGNGSGVVDISGAGAGSLSLGQVSYGITPAAGVVSTTAESLNVLRDVSMTSLLVRTNSATANSLAIDAARTVTVNGEFSAGVGAVYATGVGGILTSLNTSGGGSLVVNGGANLFRVGLTRPNASTGGDPFTFVDLSGLTNFTFNGTGHFRVGNGNSRGELNLANSGVCSGKKM